MIVIREPGSPEPAMRFWVRAVIHAGEHGVNLQQKKVTKVIYVPPVRGVKDVSEA